MGLCPLSVSITRYFTLCNSGVINVFWLAGFIRHKNLLQVGILRRKGFVTIHGVLLTWSVTSSSEGIRKTRISSRQNLSYLVFCKALSMYVVWSEVCVLVSSPSLPIWVLCYCVWLCSNNTEERCGRTVICENFNENEILMISNATTSKERDEV